MRHNSPLQKLSRYTPWCLLIVLLAACSDSDDETAKPPVVLTPMDTYTSVDERTGTLYIKDLPGSVGNTFESGHIPIFFNLQDHAVINAHDTEGAWLTLPEAKAQDNSWDICFSGIYNSYITFNNGDIEDTPGHGGTGKGGMVVLDALFDELDEAPSDDAFDAFMAEQTSSGWHDWPLGHKGWYFYSLQSHIMSAISGVTIVIRTGDGKFAKLEMKTLYLGNPESPTVNTPTPYFTFRYFLQEDGSRNLSTR
jgi:hypothetical protein